jgi:hypothetical protein
MDESQTFAAFVPVSTGYNHVEGNRRASRTARELLPPENPLRFATFASLYGVVSQETVQVTAAMRRQLKLGLGTRRSSALAERLRHAETTGGLDAVVAQLCPLFKQVAMREVPRLVSFPG